MEKELDSLLEQNQFLQSIYEGTDAAIFVVDIDSKGEMRFAGLNPAHEKLTGFKSDWIKGRTPEELNPRIPAAVCKEIRKKYQRCLDEKNVVRYEEVMPMDGKDFWWQTTLTPLKDNKGNIYRIVGSASNINEIKQKELELKEQKVEILAQNEEFETLNEELRTKNEELDERVEQKTFHLRERLKELNGLYSISKVVEESDQDLHVKLQGIVEIIPPAWQFPELTFAKIQWNSNEFKTPNFKKTKWLLKADLKANKQKIGELQVGYTKKPSMDNEDIFLKEEVSLINAMAERIGNIIERIEAEKVLKQKNEEYQALNEEYQSQNEELQVINEELQERNEEYTKTQAHLIEKEKLFRQVFENSPLGKSMTQVDGTLKMNKAFCKILGYTEKELMNKNWKEITHPDDIQESVDIVNGLLEGKYPAFQYEKRYLHKKGEIVHCEVSTTLQRDENNKPQYFISTISDITDKKKAERISLEEKQFSEKLINSLPGVFYLFDMNGKFIRWNDNFAKVTGYSGKELRQKTPVDFFTGEHQQNIAQSVEKVFKEGYTTVEANFTTKKGEEIPYLFTGILIELEGKHYLGGMGIDVTMQQEVQKKLKESEKRFRTFIQKVPVALGHVDNNTGEMKYLNERFVELFGYNLKDVPNIKDWWTVAYPDEKYRAWVVDNWTKAVDYAIKNNSEITPDIYQVTCKNGELKQVYISGITIGNDFLATLIDLTEQKAAESIIRENEEKFRALAENSDDSIFLINKKMEVVYVNSPGAKQLNTDQEMVQGKKVTELFQKENAQRQEASLKKVFNEAQILEAEEKVKFPGGEMWLSTKLIPVLDENKKVQFVYGISSNITQRKKVELELRLSELQYRNVVDNSPVSLWEEDWTEIIHMIDELKSKGIKEFSAYFEANPDFVNEALLKVKVLDVNKETLKMFEASSKEVMLESLATVFATEDTLPGFIRELVALASGKKFFEAEMALRTTKGNLVNTYLRMTFPVKGDKEGQVLVSIMNISDLKRIEKELVDSLKLYNEVIDLQNNCVAIYDVKNKGKDFFFAELNKAAEKIENIKKEDVIGKNVLDVFPGAKEMGMYDVLRKVYKTGKPKYFPVSFYEDDRIKGWRDNYVYKISSGQIISVYADVTEKKQAEEELLSSEKLLTEAQRISHVGSWELDVKTNKLYWSDEVYRMFGLKPQEFEATYEDFLENIHPDDRESVNNAYSKSLENKSPYSIVHRLLLRDGTVKYVNEQCEHILNDKGEVIRSIGMVQDITESKLAQAKIEETLEKLKKSNEELQNFAYVASHDLQEPLRMVSSFLEIIKNRYADKLDEAGMEFIEFAVDGSSRMKQLINDLLQFSRIGTRGDPFTPTNLNTVLNEVKLDLSLTIDENNFSIVSDNLPEIKADQSQMKQLFQNLISNAIKFRNSENPKLEIRVKEDKMNYLFSFSDNGLGIEKEHFDRIFVIFQRLHTREDYPGTGIGLAVCKKIVERHKGKIWLESKLNQGTTFYIQISKKLK